jgi:hypothetical protein
MTKMYKTIILYTVLYGCQTFLEQTGYYKLRMFASGMLRTTSGLTTKK